MHFQRILYIYFKLLIHDSQIPSHFELKGASLHNDKYSKRKNNYKHTYMISRFHDYTDAFMCDKSKNTWKIREREKNIGLDLFSLSRSKYIKYSNAKIAIDLQVFFYYWQTRCQEGEWVKCETRTRWCSHGFVPLSPFASIVMSYEAAASTYYLFPRHFSSSRTTKKI